MKLRMLLVGLLILLTTQQLIADTSSEILNPPQSENIQTLSAVEYLNHMKTAYKQLNYELLYLDTRQNEIEPNQLIHGVVDGKEVTYFRTLNGIIREFLQFDNKISYYKQGTQPYTLLTQRDQGIFANIANFDFEHSNKIYDYIILGKSRIAGNKAIAIRMISKDEYRYSYIIWIDAETYLPLRLDTINHANIIVEQIMVVSLKLNTEMNSWVAQLINKKLPETLFLKTAKATSWKIGWLPTGFRVVKDNQHKLLSYDTSPVSYIMLNDGMVSVSIYISLLNTVIEEKHQSVTRQGGTLLYTAHNGTIEVNIIGEIPLITAEKIAESIRPTTNDTRDRANN